MKLVLIKHARPEIDPTVPAKEWSLSQAGQHQSLALGKALKRELQPDALFCSTESKAVETAQGIGQVLGLDAQVCQGLHEQSRATAPFFEDQRQWRQAVEAGFARPNEAIYGEESFGDAAARFAQAIESLGIEDRCAAVVAHGTVISLFAQRMASVDALEMWRRLTLPSWVVMEANPWRVLDVQCGPWQDA